MSMKRKWMRSIRRIHLISSSILYETLDLSKNLRNSIWFSIFFYLGISIMIIWKFVSNDLYDCCLILLLSEVAHQNFMIPHKITILNCYHFLNGFDPCIGSKRIKVSVLTLLTFTFHNIFLPQKAEKIKIGTFECHPHFWTSLQQLSIRKQWFLFGQQKYHLLPTKFSRPNFHVLATLNNNIFNGIFARRFTLYKKVNWHDLKIFN